MIARIAYPIWTPTLTSHNSTLSAAKPGVACRQPPHHGRRFRRTSTPRCSLRVLALNAFLFEEERFVGNDARSEDPRNSFLNEVLDRRTGIPITLALVYMEVARRAGIEVEGVNFQGTSSFSLPRHHGSPLLARPHHRRASRWCAAQREHVPRSAHFATRAAMPTGTRTCSRARYQACRFSRACC